MRALERKRKKSTTMDSANNAKRNNDVILSKM